MLATVEQIACNFLAALEELSIAVPDRPTEFLDAWFTFGVSERDFDQEFLAALAATALAGDGVVPFDAEFALVGKMYSLVIDVVSRLLGRVEFGKQLAHGTAGERRCTPVKLIFGGWNSNSIRPVGPWRFLRT